MPYIDSARLVAHEFAQLQSLCGMRKMVTVFREFGGVEKSMSGFLQSMSPGLLLIARMTDFRTDGFCIIRLDQISGIRTGRYEQMWTRISLAGQHSLNATFPSIELPLDGWNTVCRALRQMDYHVIIEQENREEVHFDIGPIQDVARTSVAIRYYDPAGRLESGSTSCAYRDITTVTFGDNYSTRFRKFLRSAKSPDSAGKARGF